MKYAGKATIFLGTTIVIIPVVTEIGIIAVRAGNIYDESEVYIKIE